MVDRAGGQSDREGITVRNMEVGGNSRARTIDFTTYQNEAESSNMRTMGAKDGHVESASRIPSRKYSAPRIFCFWAKKRGGFHMPMVSVRSYTTRTRRFLSSISRRGSFAHCVSLAEELELAKCQ